MLVKSNPTTPAPLRSTLRGRGPPNAESHTHRPAAKNIACSQTNPSNSKRAQWCSRGVCQAHTITSSPREAITGENRTGHDCTGSYCLPLMPIAINGAAIATTAMCSVIWAANDVIAQAGIGPNHAAPSASHPDSKSKSKLLARLRCSRAHRPGLTALHRSTSQSHE